MDNSETQPQTLKGMDRLTLPDHARVWVYTASRTLTSEERRCVLTALDAFTQSWVAHGQPLVAQSSVLLNQVVVLALDESSQAATGCSIDSSVEAMRSLSTVTESLGDVDLLDRSWVLHLPSNADPVDVSSWRRERLHAFWAMRKAGTLTDDVRIADTTVSTLGALRHAFVVPLGSSWHAHMW